MTVNHTEEFRSDSVCCQAPNRKKMKGVLPGNIHVFLDEDEF